MKIASPKYSYKNLFGNLIGWILDHHWFSDWLVDQFVEMHVLEIGSAKSISQANADQLVKLQIY